MVSEVNLRWSPAQVLPGPDGRDLWQGLSDTPRDYLQPSPDGDEIAHGRHLVLDDSGAWQPIRKPSAVRAAANLTDHHRVRAETLRDALELDSIDFLSFVERLSEATGRRVEEADYPRLTTIASGVDFLTRKA